MLGPLTGCGSGFEGSVEGSQGRTLFVVRPAVGPRVCMSGMLDGADGAPPGSAWGGTKGPAVPRERSWKGAIAKTAITSAPIPRAIAMAHCRAWAAGSDPSTATRMRRMGSGASLTPACLPMSPPGRGGTIAAAMAELSVGIPTEAESETRVAMVPLALPALTGAGLRVVLLLAGVVLTIVGLVVGPLMQLALSRSRESLADASSVDLTRNPQGLLSALRKIAQNDKPLHTFNHATAAMYIDNPLKHHESWYHRLFDTHPPIQERIAALEKIAEVRET